jgi:2-polyprenyl-3-methyl-5-hydroxy-6-metoxy-1,4-benzoquinol methylase
MLTHGLYQPSGSTPVPHVRTTAHFHSRHALTLLILRSMSSTTQKQDQESVPPQTYDNLSALFVRRTAKKCSSYLIPHLKPNMHIIDIGCGPGSITLDLAQLVPNGHVPGIDIDTHALTQAKSLAEARGMHNVEFRQASLYELNGLPYGLNAPFQPNRRPYVQCTDSSKPTPALSQCAI